MKITFSDDSLYRSQIQARDSLVELLLSRGQEGDRGRTQAGRCKGGREQGAGSVVAEETPQFVMGGGRHGVGTGAGWGSET